jgi:2-keto-4-pentenoate hydratase/2-oxohepta-3-ene-1,7-dioic acid hydratase in catechol pathway
MSGRIQVEFWMLSILWRKQHKMNKFVRFKESAGEFWGVVDSDGTQMVRRVSGSIFGEWEVADQVGLMSEINLLPPCNPKNIVGLALNYKDLVEDIELNYEPLVFIKAVSALTKGDSSIKKPTWVDAIWVEAELAIVVKKSISNATIEEASSAVFGHVVANDVTAKNVFGRDHHLARSKSLPTFCPVSSLLIQGVDTQNLRITTSINGVLKQESSTSERIYNDAQALALVSRIIPLQPGDLVLTGTPRGALESTVRAGDEVLIEIEKIGVIRNNVVNA